jgi:hypothetical protein
MEKTQSPQADLTQNAGFLFYFIEQMAGIKK